MKTVRKHPKGFFFSFDALVALSILLISFAFVMMGKPPVHQTLAEYRQIHLLSEDAVQIFANTPFSSIEEPERSGIIAAAGLTDADMNKSLLDIVGMLWGLNKTDYAANMTRSFFKNILGNSTNYSLVVEEYGNTTIIYNSSALSSGRRILSSSTRVVSGYKENTNVTGFVARAFVLGATKETEAYSYFGGYEGNGNITKMLFLPAYVSSINETYIEMDTPSNFTLYINGAYAGDYTISTRQPLRARNWTVPAAYYSNFVNGTNNITLSFPDINYAYVGGGLIRVRYDTPIMDTSDLKKNSDGNITGRYYFPGIDGLINIFSAFYVPGTLKSLGVQLHYFSNYTVYMIIGNTSVYENSTNITQTIYLNNSFLGSLLDYSMFNQTMPLRFGTKNVSGQSEGSDAVLITDLSGSMIACDVSATIAPPDCGSPGIRHQRLYSAKESDREFVSVILANPGQKVGLVAYESSTVNALTVGLTDNATKLNSTINQYVADEGCTCTSCGIQSATDMLAATLNLTTLVASKSQWSYNDSFLQDVPPLDSNGRNWTHINYSLKAYWGTGNAPFGNGSHQIPVATNISGNWGTNKYPDLWDMASDRSTIEVDFTSGMNATANTFGWNAGNDGWDSGAQYNYDNTKTMYYNASGGRLLLSTQTGSPSNNNCNNKDCSGGYGIQTNITPEQYAMISSGGVAYVSFDYFWVPEVPGAFESSDEVMIKARWTRPGPVSYYLGSNLSSVDSTPEIDFRDNPGNSIAGTFNQNITGWITGAGTYYLDFGGKIMASDSNEGGNFSFDNVLLEVSNRTDAVYFRKNFTIDDVDSVGKGLLKVMSDDSAEVYLNSVLVLNNTATANNANYWNTIVPINRKYFVEGDNILAVKLYNRGGPSRFDLALIALNDSRNKAMLVMSDGQANTIIGGSGCGDSINGPIQAINRSCEAYNNYGIISHAVSFGSATDGQATLQAIAACGHGNYYTSNNEDELKNIYRDIANAIIAYTTQAAEISGEMTLAKLYSDSFIEFNYTPAIDLSYGNISLTFSSETFGNTSGNYSVESPKNGSYYIYPKMQVIDAKATSYSSDYWTASLEAKNTSSAYWTKVFNISAFGSAYDRFGDPFIVDIPVSLIAPGETNYARANTAKNATGFTGGSPDNRIIYSVKVRGSVDYNETFPTLEEARANASWRLGRELEALGISSMNIRTDILDVGNIPWMWGPAAITLEVWR